MYWFTKLKKYFVNFIVLYTIKKVKHCQSLLFQFELWDLFSAPPAVLFYLTAVNYLPARITEITHAKLYTVYYTLYTIQYIHFRESVPAAKSIAENISNTQAGCQIYKSKKIIPNYLFSRIIWTNKRDILFQHNCTSIIHWN